ncbi:phage terminase large subunit family protein [Caldimonas tepidiphila]|uniref:phage terminase large subunit family protein n=1 Tax=Caldimonas tepidiphila TaxID=2315841 RepID=UPI000E5A267D|nr:terminase gpA endonuclease subunit [Caldimonas tepidiphila]
MSERYVIAAETRAAIVAAAKLGLESLAAEPPQHLSEWAAEHFKLAGESSHQKGAWEAWPFQIGILDFMSDDRIEELDVQKSKRVGYTKMLTAFVAYNIAHRRRKQALWQPTDDDRDSFVKSEIEPVLEGVEAVKAARRKGKGVEDTIKYKAFRDSVLHLLGGKAARAYRRITVAVALIDEWDGFDQVVEKSSDPGTLAKGRLEGAPYPKFVGGTTPRIKGLSHVERSREKAGADLRYHIECPHCGAEHPLLWGGKDKRHGMKWERGRPETIRHVCPHCLESITQADYLPEGVPLTGTWVCIKTGLRYGADRTWRNDQGEPVRPPRHVGVQVWAAYSPQRSWESIAREFEHAYEILQTGDAGPMQGFVNETLGETWELQGERSDEHALQKRAEPYPLGLVPIGGLRLTAGVDVQRNRWEIGVWAWGRGLESWTVDHHIIEGNPANDEDWEQVTIYLQRRYPQAWAGGSALGIDSISIDSSDQTQAVYNWVRKNVHQLPVQAVKGSSEEGKPIKGAASSQEITWRGQKWANGVKLWSIGVDTAKDLLLGQLTIDTPGPGYVHFSDQLSREWFEQLTAEQRILVKGPRGGETYKWVKRRPRNEVLDCRNYALHAAFILGLDGYSEKRWQQLEARVQPPIDLFSAPAAPADVLPAPEEAATPGASQDNSAAAPTPRAAAIPRPALTPSRSFARAW